MANADLNVNVNLGDFRKGLTAGIYFTLRYAVAAAENPVQTLESLTATLKESLEIAEENYNEAYNLG